VSAGGGGVYVPPQRIGFKSLGPADAVRATALADRALAAFGLDGYWIASLTQHSNMTAKLASDHGPELALRLRTGSSVDGRTEFEWLSAVRRGTSVRVVETFADSYESNTRILEEADGSSTECSLFLWAEGRSLAADLSPENYFELGRMTAQLHTFAGSWMPPPGLRPLKWDRTIYYEGTSLVISDSRYSAFVSPDDAVTVERVVREADAELNRLSAGSGRMYLHGNIEMWNVLTTAPGQLRLLDFEDVMFGQPVQDIATTLYYGRERSDYSELNRAYESGYRCFRDWPVRDSRQIGLLIAARATMLLNHALQTEPDKQPVTDRLLPLILAAAI
jgi:Ser/Thr protein kinase RdoA (MazF antagonist)